jgi:stress response protein YsnF
MTSDPFGDIRDAQGRELLDSASQPLGRIREIFLDETTGEPAWAAIEAPGGADHLVLAPLAHSTVEGDAVRLAVPRERIESAPATGVAERISPEHMDRVRAHYGDQPAVAQDTMAGRSEIGASDTAVSGDIPSIVRSEEELFVQRERVPRERVRLVKRIVTETVTQTIEVRREELHLERVTIAGAGDDLRSDPSATAETPAAASTNHPATAPVAGTASAAPGSGSEGGASGLSALRARASSLVGKASERFAGGHGFGEPFTDETLDVTLHEEQVVVSKRVVPRERVRIHREVVTEQQRITDDLRKERIEIDRLGLDADTRVEGGEYRSDSAL